MPIFGFQSLLQNPGSETHKVCNRYSLAVAAPKPFPDHLIPAPFWGKAQHIFRIPYTNHGLYDVFLVLVWPCKFPRLNLCWGYLQNGSIVTLGMNVKEIKNSRLFSCGLEFDRTGSLRSQLEWWSVGILEYWVPQLHRFDYYSSIPLFHYSTHVT